MAIFWQFFDSRPSQTEWSSFKLSKSNFALNFWNFGTKMAYESFLIVVWNVFLNKVSLCAYTYCINKSAMALLIRIAAWKKTALFAQSPISLWQNGWNSNKTAVGKTINLIQCCRSICTDMAGREASDVVRPLHWLSSILLGSWLSHCYDLFLQINVFTVAQVRWKNLVKLV